MSKYRIRAVAQLTGLSPALIRAWEARYSLVEPERTAAGYRLYSDEDVALLLGAQRLVQQGIAPMQVARLPRQRLRDEGGAATAHQPPGSVDGLPEQSYALLLEQVLSAFSAFDGQRAEALLGRPLVLLSPTAACQNVLVPLLREVGERWHRGEMSIAAEHFGTGLIRNKLQGLLETFRGHAGGRRVMCACPPGELHEAGLLMFALEAASQGWEPIYLGANLPIPELIAAVQDVRPELVALSLTMQLEAPTLRALLTQAHAGLAGCCPIVVGGPGVIGFDEVIWSTGCQLAPRSGRLDELVGSGTTKSRRRAAVASND